MLYLTSWDLINYITREICFDALVSFGQNRSTKQKVFGNVLFKALSLARRVVSLDKELYSTLSLFTQVYKWVQATYCWGVTL